ncbi:MAG: hypothetical protein H6766_02695 [Candidatus Peribacteria bacterium]|nr:MAG: hypothetical protein H6766_02695 [Candidatus Peribacteria bacterium]
MVKSIGVANSTRNIASSENTVPGKTGRIDPIRPVRASRTAMDIQTWNMVREIFS